MDRRLFVVFVMLLGLLWVAVATRAAAPGAETAAWSFFDWMGQADYSMDALGGLLDDPQAGAERLKEAEALEWALMHMKAQVDTMKPTGKALEQLGDAATVHADMRRGLNGALQSALKLEAALLAGDVDGAKAELAALKQAERAMHGTHRAGRGDARRER